MNTSTGESEGNAAVYPPASPQIQAVAVGGSSVGDRLHIVLRKLCRAQSRRPNTEQREAIAILKEVLGLDP